ncbi:MAG: TrkH family potassium uptake protein [Paracoccaceae bacterium]
MDLRPVGYVIGLLLAALGATMLAPLLADLAAGNGHWPAFFTSAVLTFGTGALMALSCASGTGEGLTIRQTFLLTTAVWVVLPAFGAIPLMIGAPALSLTDAMFEAMSGLTTTGATVLVGIDALPEGIKLWRGVLQWLGGIGIVVVAMVFLPELKVGGMQIFRSEAFDTLGKILPRAGDIAARISVVYVGLTATCAMAYGVMGMEPFDAAVHAMTTVATGGMANTDASFSAFGPGVHYVAVTFMLLAALPFVRYVQLIGGTAKPLWRDGQVRAFFGTVAVLVLAMTFAVWARADLPGEEGFRAALFNVTSIMTGTGYASADYMAWGSLAVMLFFFIGLIGGCAGSTACSIKIFRYQLLFASIRVQIKRMRSPHGIFQPRYEGRVIADDVLNSVMAFFTAFLAVFVLAAIALGLTGLDFITSVSGAATALANIGPGLGPVIGPAGNFAPLEPVAKWILLTAMLIGRLEVMAVFTLLSARFWTD